MNKLDGCNIGNIGLKHIGKSNWPKLMQLNIGKDVVNKKITE